MSTYETPPGGRSPRLILLEWIEKGGKILLAGFLVLSLCSPVRAISGEICFSQGDAGKMVTELERCRDIEAGLAKCSEVAEASREAVSYCESLREDLSNRIEVLTKERDEALKVASDATEAGKKASHAPWYERAWDAGKWALAGGAAVAIGIAVAGH